MFIAMNRFKIAPGFEAAFEQLWRERESHLEEVPGFRSFALLKLHPFGEAAAAPAGEAGAAAAHALYASHTIWESREAFEAWTESVQFRKAHAQGKAPKGTYLGHPELELFEAVA